MTDLNTVALGGRITRDCVLEKTQTGLSMVRVSMAVNRSTKKKDSDEWTDKATFIDFTLFGNYADVMFKHLKKGTYINVQGFLDMDTWTDSTGKNQQRLKFVPEVGKLNPWVGGSRKADSPAPEEYNAASPEDIPSDSTMIY